MNFKHRSLIYRRFWLAWPMALCSVLTENCTRASLAVSVYFSDLPTS